MDLLPVCDCTGHTENTGSLNYMNFPNDDICHYRIYYLKVTFVNISNDLIRKLFKYGKLPSL